MLYFNFHPLYTPPLSNRDRCVRDWIAFVHAIM